MKKLIPASILLVSLVGTTAQAFDAKTYYEQKCLRCHTIGAGDGDGPDMLPVFTENLKSKHRSRQWLKKFIAYPYGMIHGDPDEEGYEKPDAHAKALFKKFKNKVMEEVDLEDADMNALLDYMDKTSKAVKAKKQKPLKQK